MTAKDTAPPAEGTSRFNIPAFATLSAQAYVSYNERLVVMEALPDLVAAVQRAKDELEALSRWAQEQNDPYGFAGQVHHWAESHLEHRVGARFAFEDRAALVLATDPDDPSGAAPAGNDGDTGAVR